VRFDTPNKAADSARRIVVTKPVAQDRSVLPAASVETTGLSAVLYLVEQSRITRQ